MSAVFSLVSRQAENLVTLAVSQLPPLRLTSHLALFTRPLGYENHLVIDQNAAAMQ